MKKTLLFILNLVIFAAFAQAPQAIKYQAIARDAGGNMLLNQNISMRISILQNSTNGIIRYSETHTTVSNAFGLVNIEIGNGLAVYGSFSSIDWSHGNYFVRVEADANGGNNFSLLGVSQLLSVPYALYANSAGVPRMTDDQRDALTDPAEGMIIYNLTTQCLNYRRSNSWSQVCGDCVPLPTVADAGADRVVCADSSVQLSGNIPVKGVGTWSVVSGTGGSFSDVHNPAAFFYGTNNQSYDLVWEIATPCNALNDMVSITFMYVAPPYAGADQYLYDTVNSTYLAAVSPGEGNYGQWSIVSGSGGVITDPSNPASLFSLQAGVDYVLRWTTSTSCDTSFDDVIIAYCPDNQQANAGPDTTLLFLTNYVLQGNPPASNQTGHWTIVSGNGGYIADTTLYNATFYGALGNTYTLKWTLSTACDASNDLVVISLSAIAPRLFVVGDATSAGWNNANAIAMNLGATNQFDQNLLLKGIPNGMKFILNKGAWDMIWGTSETTPVVSGQEYDLVMWGNNILIPDTSNYHIEVNLTTNKFKIIAFTSPDSLYLLGGSTPAGWNPTQALPFTQVSLGIFQIFSPLVTSGYGYKFLPSFGTYYGDWGQDPAQAGKIIQNGEENCPVADSGFYMIQVDFTNLTYSAVKTDWGIIGDATPGGWTSGTDMTYIGGAEPYSFEIPNVSLQNGFFKFLANDNYAINLGDEGNNGSLERYGPNIPVTAGTYAVKLMLQPGNWTYTLTLLAPDPCAGMSSIVYGGQEYHTVAIGTQCWMKENLNIGTMINGSSNQTNDNIEKYCYNNEPANCAIYGGLYQWTELMKSSVVPGYQGICPGGFHVPTTAEWDLLLDTLGGGSVAGGKMKEAGFTHWASPNTDATNESGFTALGAGERKLNGDFGFLQSYGEFWTSNIYDATGAWGRSLTSTSGTSYIGSFSNSYGFSARCIKNATTQPFIQANAGPDQTVNGNSTQLAGNSPGTANGTWSINGGTGGVIADIHNPQSQFTGVYGQTYQLVWTITMTSGNSIDVVNITFVFNCGNTVNYGGQTYNTILIGSQCWMKENLNIGTMINSLMIQTNNGIVEKYCYNNNPANCAAYGGLYQWDEMMQYVSTAGSKGLCPDGFHIPDVFTEWQALIDTLGGFALAGGKLKEAGFAHWDSPNTDATNASGFTALGAGYCASNSTFVGQNLRADFWSSSGLTTSAFECFLLYSAGTVNNNLIQIIAPRNTGLAVRCLMDN